MKLDDITFAETWLTDVSSGFCANSLPGYTLYFDNRKTNSYAGDAVFIKIEFVISSISTAEVKSFGQLEIHIVNPYDIILSVIYRPPNNSSVSFQEDFTTYITHLAQ